MKRKLNRLMSVLALISLATMSFSADKVIELSWEELIPESEALLPSPQQAPGGVGSFGFEDDEFDKGFTTPDFQPGVVEALDGKQVKIPGFIVPLEIGADGKVSEFLLVPYFGACTHFPPPPANQIVFVTMDDPVNVESPWAPIWVYGELATEYKRSDLGSSGYSLAANQIEEYEY